MEHSWIDTIITWGAYVLGTIAIYISKLVHGKFQLQDEQMARQAVLITTLDKELVEHQLDASRRYVDKQEYLNTLNRMYDKLDSIDKSINVLNRTMCGDK